MPRILVFGAGAVGIFYAYVLYKSGAEVALVCRSNYDAVAANGIMLDSELFGHVTAKIPAVRLPSDAAGDWDYIVVCSKVYPGIPEIIKPAVSAQTCLVLIQNGIETETSYREAFPNNTIITSAVYVPVEQVNPGHVVHGKIEKLELGTYPHNADASAQASLHTFAELIQRGGGTAIICKDVQEQRWLKLAINITWSPLCALTLLDDINFIRSSEPTITVANRITAEALAIAAAKGYTSLDTEKFMKQFGRAKGQLKAVGREPSMLTDVRQGR